MNLESNRKLSTDPYKGVRDFYPPDMAVENHIFRVMRKTAENFGYIEYNASILEPAELYRAKSGEEIVNDQTYTFIDRGEREVTLRPEMTPTIARMVARSRRELSLPLRWYSIPNLFRYEKPQRGRLREHWQLNADLFGVASLEGEVEIISMASALMHNLGANDEMFEIRVNNRKLLSEIFNYYELSESESYTVSKIIDKKEKISKSDYESSLREILGNETEQFAAILDTTDTSGLRSKLPDELKNSEALADIEKLLAELGRLGVKNTVFRPSLMRGFDYYTRIVFEVFDTAPDNRRSLFGGGRYDDLLDIFGSDKVTAVGFGMGDVTARDFLETHNLLPEYKSSTDLYVVRVDKKQAAEIDELASALRKKGLNVAVDLSDRKVGDQIRTADRQAIPYVLVVGEEELKTGQFNLKNLKTRKEKKAGLDEIASIIKNG